MEYIQRGGENLEVEEVSHCPHCHSKISTYIGTCFESTDDKGENIVISSSRCTNPTCKKIIIAEHNIKTVQRSHVVVSYFKVTRYLNGRIQDPNIPEVVLTLRDGRTMDPDAFVQTSFIDTYIQSLEAESLGLNEISGMGFRKAIEYLVKDWAISKHQDKAEEIKQAWLGQVIKEYFHGDIKDILERATWLGNDQAHYIQLFEEYDLQLLKELIQFILSEFDRDYRKEQYLAIQGRKH